MIQIRTKKSRTKDTVRNQYTHRGASGRDSYNHAKISIRHLNLWSYLMNEKFTDLSRFLASEL